MRQKEDKWDGLCIFFFFIHFSSIIFLEPPKIGPFTFPEKIMNEGDFAQLTCVVTSGDLPLSITWTFHGDKVGLETGITTTNLGPRMSILAINSVGYRQQGKYTCQAKNEAGIRTHTTELHVNGITLNM